MAFSVVQCPACQTAFRIRSERAALGTRVRCGRCNAVFSVSASNVTVEPDTPVASAPTPTAPRAGPALGPPPPYQPISIQRVTRRETRQPLPPRAPAAVNPDTISRFGPPPPYLPSPGSAGVFERGGAPDLDPWRATTSFRPTIDEPAPSGIAPGPGLAIGRPDDLATGASGSTGGGDDSWSLPDDRTERYESVPTGTLPPLTAHPTAFPGDNEFGSSGPRADDARAREADDDQAASLLSSLMPSPWMAIPLAAGVLGSGLYWLREDVMWAFPGTRPIYRSLGLDSPDKRDCDYGPSIFGVHPGNGKDPTCFDEQGQRRAPPPTH